MSVPSPFARLRVSHDKALRLYAQERAGITSTGSLQPFGLEMPALRSPPSEPGFVFVRRADNRRQALVAPHQVSFPSDLHVQPVHVAQRPSDSVSRGNL